MLRSSHHKEEEKEEGGAGCSTLKYSMRPMRTGELPFTPVTLVTNRLVLPPGGVEGELTVARPLSSLPRREASVRLLHNQGGAAAYDRPGACREGAEANPKLLRPTNARTMCSAARTRV